MPMAAGAFSILPAPTSFPSPTPPSGLSGLSPARAKTLTGTGEGANLGYCVDAVLAALSSP